MDRKALTGALLAAAVGAMFLSSPLFAQESSGSTSQANVKCVGANSCKGQSACKGGAIAARDRTPAKVRGLS